MIVAREIRMEGVVQGVGFRPFVFRLAQEYGIKGWILNSSEGVTIWAEARDEMIDAFYQAILAHPPKLAMIVKHSIKPQELQGFDHFQDALVVTRHIAAQRLVVHADRVDAGIGHVDDSADQLTRTGSGVRRRVPPRPVRRR